MILNLKPGLFIDVIPIVIPYIDVCKIFCFCINERNMVIAQPISILLLWFFL